MVYGCKRHVYNARIHHKGTHFWKVDLFNVNGNGSKEMDESIIIDGYLEVSHKRGQRQYIRTITHVTNHVKEHFEKIICIIVVSTIIYEVQFTIEMMNEVESEV